MNELAIKAITGLLLAALLMVIGASIDHHFFVVPLKSQIDSQKGADAQARHDAIIAIQTQEKTQDEHTAQSATNYAGTVSRIDAAIDRMRKQPATHNECLPAAPFSSGEPAAPIVQSPGDCESTGDDPCTVVRSYFDNGLKDAAAVEGYSEWVQSQHFPISKD